MRPCEAFTIAALLAAFLIASVLGIGIDFRNAQLQREIMKVELSSMQMLQFERDMRHEVEAKLRTCEGRK